MNKSSFILNRGMLQHGRGHVEITSRVIQLTVTTTIKHKPYT